MVHVPHVQYKSSSEAIALLQAQGLEVQTKNEESDSVQKDHVIRQSVAAGTEVQVGTTVVIYISLESDGAIMYDPTTTQANVTTENSTTEKQQHQRIINLQILLEHDDPAGNYNRGKARGRSRESGYNDGSSTTARSRGRKD